MDQIQIKNVRSLKDTGKIKLSPITLLVGENSSGKSTFLRIFPLIKQSIRKHTDGPLLWAGDADDYVDFGSFRETVTNDGSNKMTFCFSFSTEKLNSESLLFWRDRTNAKDDFPERDQIVYTITIAQNKTCEREYISDLFLQLNDVQVKFELDEKGLAKKACVDGKYSFKVGERRKMDRRFPVSGLTYDSEAFGFVLPFSSDFFDDIPEIFLKNGLDENEQNELVFDDTSYIFVDRYFRDAFTVLQWVGQCLCKGLSWEKIQNFSPKRGFIDSRMVQSILQCLNEMEPERKRKGFTIAKLMFIYKCFPLIDEYLNAYFRQVHYIAPVRATAERYYRLKNLAIDEVDYQGKNLALFLASLPEKRLKSFQDWTRKYFGFYVKTDPVGGHASVKVALNAEGEPVFVNVSDTGFGYSQILPIITQLWHLSSQKRHHRNSNVPLVIAIEQPELHLHPGLQAKLTKAFIASIQLAKENGYQLQLLLETHSETIVNCFGRAIAEADLSPEDISVVLFEKQIGAKSTNVQMSGYDTDGYLENWPVGFFSPKE